MFKRRLVLAAAVACACLAGNAMVRADVKLPAIISDNMLLQANKPVAIWGAAAAGEKVTVAFDGQTASATADAAGKWKVTLPALKADDAGDMTITGNNTLTVKNVLVGSVWICSGQSNMSFGLPGSHNAATEIPQANYPKIRLFTVPRETSMEPRAEVTGQWTVCTPTTAPAMSAVAYFFGRDVHVATGLPVGLIHTSWGGTPAEAWTSLGGLQKDAELKGYVDTVEKILQKDPAIEEGYQKQLAAYEKNHKAWQEKVEAPYKEAVKKWAEDSRKARAAHTPEPARPAAPKPGPRAPEQPGKGPHTPTVLYNAMIAPLLPYAIEGAIWYQGESNAGRAVEYRTLFARMISDWREKWNQGDFPFLFVQLANFMAREKEPSNPDWAWLREAQTMTLKLPNTGMAVAIDIGQGDNIHPKDKADVGHRLALNALKMVYGKDVLPCGPLFEGLKVEGNQARISFKDVGKGLTIGVAPATQPGVEAGKPEPELKGFAIAGADQKFVWAKATIDGNTVVVSSAEVANPVAVRYAWANNPECNLYNQDGLPASPFRTDDWPQPTKK